TQGRRQLCARQRRMRRKLDRRRLVLKRGVLVEEFVDPNGQGEGRAIEDVVLETFDQFLLGLARTLALLDTPIFVQKGINLGAPIAVSENLRPAHFPRDNFITLWVVDVLLQQFHILFRALVLLLEEALPIVFVPDSFPFALEVGHDLTKRQLGRVRKKFPRFTNLLSATRAWFGDAIGRRPRRYRGLSPGVTSPQFRAPVRS